MAPIVERHCPTFCQTWTSPAPWPQQLPLASLRQLQSSALAWLGPHPLLPSFPSGQKAGLGPHNICLHFLLKGFLPLGFLSQTPGTHWPHWPPWTVGISLLAPALWTCQVGLSTLLEVRAPRTGPSVTNSELAQLFNKHLLSTYHVAGIVVGIWDTAVDKTSKAPSHAGTS